MLLRGSFDYYGIIIPGKGLVIIYPESEDFYLYQLRTPRMKDGSPECRLSCQPDAGKEGQNRVRG